MRKFILSVSLVIVTACAKSNHSIYGTLGNNEDGVISSQIPNDSSDPNDPVSGPLQGNAPPLVLPDQLTTDETKIVKTKYNAAFDKFSFIVVSATDKNVMRSYKSQQPRRLASVTKVPTSLAALENVPKIDVSVVRSMLKSSNNGEASHYLRQAVAAIYNFITPGSGYSSAHSCPATGSSTLKQEYPAAALVLKWLQGVVADVDWAGATLKDGAGCDYGNQMTPVQLANIFAYADDKGASFGGYTYEKLLSISGVDGTWAAHNADRRGQVLAKTGTLNANSNLAGYFYAKRSGVMHKYYFAMLVEKSSSQTTAQARTFIESFVRYWINYYSVEQGAPLAQL